MFDVPSFKIGKIFGIPVEVNLSWLVIFGLVTFTLATTYFPATVAAALGDGAARAVAWWAYYAVGLVTAVTFFASILAHELSHSLVARARGGHVERITLFIFGGVAQIDEEPETPASEFLMAAAGPAMSLALAGIGYLGYGLTVGQQASWWLWAPLEYIAFINLFVAIFNLAPGFPLDGGRVLRSMLWALTRDLLKATRWAVRSGQFIGWSMVVLAVSSVLRGSADLIWFGLVGWFIASLAGQAYRQQELKTRLSGQAIADVMTPSPEYVSGDQSLETLVHDHFLGRRHSRYPVIHQGVIVGLVTLPDVKRVERADWPFTRVLDVADRNMSELVVEAVEPVTSVLARLAGDRPGALLVVKDGHLAGILTRSDVLASIQREEPLA